MRFIMEQGFDIQEGQALAFQEWLRAHEDEIAKACPPGIEYMGTYVAIYTDQRSAGMYRTLWRMDSYGAQDRFAESMQGPGTFAELMRDAMRFGDFRNDANGSQILLKAVVDASIWEPEG